MIQTKSVSSKGRRIVTQFFGLNIWAQQEVVKAVCIENSVRIPVNLQHCNSAEEYKKFFTVVRDNKLKDEVDKMIQLYRKK